MSASQIAQGFGRAYIAPYNASSLEALPADTVARNTAWGGNWVDLGMTGGVQAGISNEFNHVMVDQSTNAVRSFVTEQESVVEIVLKNVTVEHLRYALGFGTLSTSGSSGVLQIRHNPTLTEYTIGIEGPSPTNDPANAQRIQLPRVVPISEPEIVFSREEETMVTVQFKALTHGADGDLWVARQYRP